MILRKILSLVVAVLFSLTISAQIGYQVALLNTATGEPRALETVKVDIAITNSVGNTIYQGTQSSTTNEFGILSLSVGNSETFQNVDWSKLPLYISATVDDVLIGKTQILSVPVAEHAKHYGTLTKEMLTGKTWKYTYVDSSGHQFTYTCSFSSGGTFSCISPWASDSAKGTYFVENNIVFMKYLDPLYNDKLYNKIFLYSSHDGCLYDIGGHVYY